jgi:hypothetical protein
MEIILRNEYEAVKIIDSVLECRNSTIVEYGGVKVTLEALDDEC